MHYSVNKCQGTTAVNSGSRWSSSASLLLLLLLSQQSINPVLAASSPNNNNPATTPTHSHGAAAEPQHSQSQPQTQLLDPESSESQSQQSHSKKRKKKKENVNVSTGKKKKATKSSTRSSISSNKKKKTPSVSQSTFVRRIQREWKDAIQLGIAYDWVRQERKQTKSIQPSNSCEGGGYLCLGPMHKNLYHWHFTIEGLRDSVYECGLYHGRLILPQDYPASPPRVQVWTPNGRFQVGKDICLSASNYHPETWNPSAWNLRTLLESLRLHMITPANEVGSCQSTSAKRKVLAFASRTWAASFQGIHIDHERMIQQGMFRSLEDDDEDVATTATPAATTAALQHRRPRQHNKNAAGGIPPGGAFVQLQQQQQPSQSLISARLQLIVQKIVMPFCIFLLGFFLYFTVGL